MSTTTKKTKSKPAESFPSAAESAADHTLQQTNVEAITPNPYQPRRDFEHSSLSELADSMDESLIHPVVVRFVPGAPAGEQYQLIDGERRWRAARLRNWESIPTIVRYDVSDEQMATMAIDANDQRRDLNAIERAAAYQRLVTPKSQGGLGMTQHQVGQRFGLSQGAVSILLRLLKLPDYWQQQIISQEISAKDARLLLPWIEHRRVMEAIQVEYSTGEGKSLEETIQAAIETSTRPMHGTYKNLYNDKTYPVLPVADDGAELERLYGELGLVSYGCQDDFGQRPAFRATNVNLWDQLQASARERVTQEALGDPDGDTDESEADQAAEDHETWGDAEEAGEREEAATKAPAKKKQPAGPRDLVKVLNLWFEDYANDILAAALKFEELDDCRQVFTRQVLELFWQQCLDDELRADFFGRFTSMELEAIAADYGVFLGASVPKARAVKILSTSPPARHRLPLLFDPDLPTTGKADKGKAAKAKGAAKTGGKPGRGRPKKAK